MKIRITLEDAVITATLTDSQTTRDFFSLLPLTLTLEDYAGTGKISYLPQKLSTEDAPPGSAPAIGDITYYAPWGNLAIFYSAVSNISLMLQRRHVNVTSRFYTDPEKAYLWSISLVKNSLIVDNPQHKTETKHPVLAQ